MSDELPPLPSAAGPKIGVRLYTADDMHTYARAAVERERERAATILRAEAQRSRLEDLGGGGYYRDKYAPIIERRILACVDAIRARAEKEQG